MSVCKYRAFIFLDQPPPWVSLTVHHQRSLQPVKTEVKVPLHLLWCCPSTQRPVSASFMSQKRSGRKSWPSLTRNNLSDIFKDLCNIHCDLLRYLLAYLPVLYFEMKITVPINICKSCPKVYVFSLYKHFPPKLYIIVMCSISSRHTQHLSFLRL